MKFEYRYYCNYFYCDEGCDKECNCILKKYRKKLPYDYKQRCLLNRKDCEFEKLFVNIYENELNDNEREILDNNVIENRLMNNNELKDKY